MARPRSNLQTWQGVVVAMRERLAAPLVWFPLPVLLPLGLILMLTAHLVSATNPRMGNPASLITFPSEPRRDSALWFSVTPIGREVVVTTNDRRVFRWPQQLTSLRAIDPFVSYLRGRVAKEIAAAALLKQAFSTQTTAVIAVDQRLKYLHMRPIIAALAEAGISSYALETQNPSYADARSPHRASRHAAAGGEP